jgi:thioredoxin reductase (NADPH)
VELSEEARTLAGCVTGFETVGKLPLVLFSDGEPLRQPSTTELAGRIGLQTTAAKPFYDLVIVGGGPAGLAAAVYGASEGLHTLLIEREAPGGQAGTSSRIENYLGFPVGLSGSDLARRAVAQARRFGVEILAPQAVQSLRTDNDYRLLTLSDGIEIGAHAVILALGVSWRRLDTPGLEQFTGAGVYYGAAQTEALACEGEDVYMIGGANSAGQAAMNFAKHARSVTMLVRGDSLTKSMSQYLIEQIAATPNITVQTHTSVIEAKGGTQLESLVLQNAVTGATETVPAQSLFIFIGAIPHTDWLGDVVQRDGRGYLLTGPDWPVRECRPTRCGRRNGPPFCSKPAYPACLRWATCATARSSGWPRAWGKGRSASSLCNQYWGRCDECLSAVFRTLRTIEPFKPLPQSGWNGCAIAPPPSTWSRAITWSKRATSPPRSMSLPRVAWALPARARG